MVNREATVEQICDALRLLPEEQLHLVLKYVEELEPLGSDGHHVAEEPIAPLYNVHAVAIRTGISDLADQHDHYLYGSDKHDA